MEQALRTRDVIGQAKGIHMARLHVDADHAFEMLRQGSHNLNIKLSDLATHMAETGELPADQDPGPN